jgi:hypothetical protein
MISEIVRIFHDPATIFGLLPFVYGLGGIYFYIIYIAYGKGMEIDFQNYFTIVLLYIRKNFFARFL